MGYTHYLKTNESAPVTHGEWARIRADFHELRKALPWKFKASFEDDETAVCDIAVLEDSPAMILFNGRDENGEEKSCESFVLLGPEDSEEAQEIRQYGSERFCKTKRLPYDLMVCAMLIVAERKAPGAWEISSDGEPEDWQSALEFVRHVLGNGYELPVAVEDSDRAPEQPKIRAARPRWSPHLRVHHGKRSYGHWMVQNRDTPVRPKEWGRIRDDFDRLCAALPRQYIPAHDRRQIQISAIHAIEADDRWISFRGADSAGNDQTADACCLLGLEDSENPPAFSTRAAHGQCTTARLPYDHIVCALLIVAEHRAPGAWRIGSDGGPDDWQPALDFVHHVLGTAYGLPPGVKNSKRESETVNERNMLFGLADAVPG